MLSRFSSSHHAGFLQCWSVFSSQVERKLCVLVPPLELRPLWWHCKGGLCAIALFSPLSGVLWGAQHSVSEREIPLAFCVGAGFTGNRSLMKTFLAQHFFHLQAVVTGTVQKPSTASSFVDVWQGGSRSGEQGLTRGCFNWRQCCGSVYQWVGDDLVSSQPCSLVIAPQGSACKRICGSSLYYRVTGVESWICSPRSWQFLGENVV